MPSSPPLRHRIVTPFFPFWYLTVTALVRFTIPGSCPLLEPCHQADQLVRPPLSLFGLRGFNLCLSLPLCTASCACQCVDRWAGCTATTLGWVAGQVYCVHSWFGNFTTSTCGWTGGLGGTCVQMESSCSLNVPKIREAQQRAGGKKKKGSSTVTVSGFEPRACLHTDSHREAGRRL